MEELVKELKSLIKGQVLSDEASLEHYSTDGSIFKMLPWAIVLPKDKEDIISLAKWVSEKKKAIQNPEINKRLSITSRGKATDQAGGPLSDGIILRFPGYLDKILEIGPDFVRVEPGAVWSDVFSAFSAINRYIPPYPASYKFSTLGGGVANNGGGEKTVKYGSVKDWVTEIKMVLEDGAEVSFKEFQPKEIAEKQAQNNLEGEIYRKVNDLLIGNHNLIQNYRLKANKISTGYNLDAFSDGNLNLAKLICGSQGTLGIISEIKFKTIPRAPLTGLLLIAFDNLEKAGEAVPKILKYQPSALEMVDQFLIGMVQKEKPEMVASIMEGRKMPPAIVLLAEFEGNNLDEIKEVVNKTKIEIKSLAQDIKEAFDKEEQEKLWAARRSAALIAEGAQGAKKALPFIEDSAVPPEKLAFYLDSLYKIMEKYKVEFSVWGHAGNGNLHLQPFLDLADKNDVEKLFKIAEEVYSLAISLGGTISAEHNDGLMRSPFLKEEFGPVYKLFEEIKNVFDPLNIFNPHKKIGVDLDFVRKQLRENYIIPETAGRS